LQPPGERAADTWNAPPEPLPSDAPTAFTTAPTPPPARPPETTAAASPGPIEPPVASHALDAREAIAAVVVPPVPLRAARPHEPFRECATCPEMIELPGGTCAMGSNDDPSEKPVVQVTVRSFALGRLPVTIGEWRQCVAAKACSYEPNGDDDMPMRNVSWNDAQQYAAWLSSVTGRKYRLPTEAEWEYAARAGTSTKYWWGNQFIAGKADCNGCGAADAREPMKAGSFAANPFGLHDMAGSVTQWTADCWHKNYRGAPTNGSARDAPNCRERVLRGGSWKQDASYARASSRDRYDATVRYPTHGLRVARSSDD
jgi:formylglycine-generating enzyme required for sulfatase activity